MFFLLKIGREVQKVTDLRGNTVDILVECPNFPFIKLCYRHLRMFQ